MRRLRSVLIIMTAVGAAWSACSSPPPKITEYTRDTFTACCTDCDENAWKQEEQKTCPGIATVEENFIKERKAAQFHGSARFGPMDTNPRTIREACRRYSCSEDIVRQG